MISQVTSVARNSGSTLQAMLICPFCPRCTSSAEKVWIVELKVIGETLNSKQDFLVVPVQCKRCMTMPKEDLVEQPTGESISLRYKAYSCEISTMFKKKGKMPLCGDIGDVATIWNAESILEVVDFDQAILRVKPGLSMDGVLSWTKLFEETSKHELEKFLGIE